MKQTKLVANILLLIISLVLYFCAGVNLYALMKVTKLNFSCIILATILLVYRKEIIYLLIEREKKDDKIKIKKPRKK